MDLLGLKDKLPSLLVYFNVAVLVVFLAFFDSLLNTTFPHVSQSCLMVGLLQSHME